MSSPARRGWLNPIISLTIRSEVIGDFHEPYGAIVTVGPDFLREVYRLQRRRLSSENPKVQVAQTSVCVRRIASQTEVCATKSKGADLPQSRRLTLQSQFSQGESMNEEILNASRTARVAEILQ